MLMHTYAELNVVWQEKVFKTSCKIIKSEPNQVAKFSEKESNDQLCCKSPH